MYSNFISRHSVYNLCNCAFRNIIKVQINNMAKLGSTIIHKQSNQTNSATVIFLHGAGGSAEDLYEWVKVLKTNITLPHVKFLFPTAPKQPYKPFNNEPSNVWFNRHNYTQDSPEHLESINSSALQIKELIDKEIENGIPLNRVVIGGFSMGGGLALHVGYRFVSSLAGVFTLSSFLNTDSLVYKEMKNMDIPLYMVHGRNDDLIPLTWGEKTFKNLAQLGVKGRFIQLDNTLHELTENEIEDLWKWFNVILPPSESDK